MYQKKSPAEHPGKPLANQCHSPEPILRNPRMDIPIAAAQYLTGDPLDRRVPGGIARF
jgi:hypothetical protein